MKVILRGCWIPHTSDRGPTELHGCNIDRDILGQALTGNTYVVNLKLSPCNVIVHGIVHGDHLLKSFARNHLPEPRTQPKYCACGHDTSSFAIGKPSVVWMLEFQEGVAERKLE
jgi:hypothetical protein